MTSKQRLLNALLQKPVDHIPAAGVVTAVNKAAIKYAGVGFRQSLASAEKYAALAAAPYELYGLESVKLPFAIEILRNGTAEQVRRKCRECIDNGVDVLHAGCSWPPDVPDENARAFVNAVRG